MEIQKIIEMDESGIVNKFPHRIIPFAFAIPPSEQLRNPLNTLKTTRYNIFTFFPVALFLQLTKVVPLFYLMNGIIQALPATGLNNPLATLIPLSFVILLGIIKEFVVEIKRWKEDKKFNSTVSFRLI
jgi:hypothetical protein